MKKTYNLDTTPLPMVNAELVPKGFRIGSNDTESGYRVFRLDEGDCIYSNAKRVNRFVAMLEGEATIVLNGSQRVSLKANEMVFESFDMTCHLTALKPTYIIIHTFHAMLPEVEKLIYQLSDAYGKQAMQRSSVLKIHPVLQDFAHVVCRQVEAGMMSPWLTRIKRLESFYLLSICTPKEDIAAMFTPLIKKRKTFHSIVIANYDKVDSIDDLARLTGLCRTNFYARFKEEFGMPVGQWMNIRRAWKVRETAADPDMTVGEMMVRCGFTSNTNLGRFTQTYFGCKPKELIAMVRNGVIPEVRKPFSELE